MPSSATSRLRLEKPAAGELSGAWAPNANGVFDRIDEAIAGLTSINTTGGLTTLTANNFAADQARAAILQITGTLASNAEIRIPAASKVYAVRNATSGAFTVTVKTASGSGAVVLQGTTALVMCDGTNCFLAEDTNIVKANTTKDLTAGFTSTSKDQGTKTSGTFTPSFATGNVQHCVNGGAFTLGVPAGHGTMQLDVTNNASAGAITTSGYTKVTGAFTTTNGHKFRCFVSVGNGGSLLNIVALQ